MIICKDGCYAYTGKTVAEAFHNYNHAHDDHNCLSPNELQWFNANEMELSMTLSPKVTPVSQKSSPRKPK